MKGHRNLWLNWHKEPRTTYTKANNNNDKCSLLNCCWCIVMVTTAVSYSHFVFSSSRPLVNNTSPTMRLLKWRPLDVPPNELYITWEKNKPRLQTPPTHQAQVSTSMWSYKNWLTVNSSEDDPKEKWTFYIHPSALCRPSCAFMLWNPTCECTSAPKHISLGRKKRVNLWFSPFFISTIASEH